MQSFLHAAGARSAELSPSSDVARVDHFVRVLGVEWPLLPCEVPLAPELRKLSSTTSACAAIHDAALIAVLRAHPFIIVKARPATSPEVVAGAEPGACDEEHFRMNINAFHRWLKQPEAAPFKSIAGGPSDDGLYTISAVLRYCMPRGLSRFTFANAAVAPILIRGFRKFTGLTADDEDEESGATACKENFFYSSAAAERFTVTTKSNGENGKFGARQVLGTTMLFAGSKNTCLAWRADQDVTSLHPPGDDGSVPGPVIAAAMQRLWRSWPPGRQESFVAAVGSCTLMLEHNSSHHEHVFPIAADYVEFVAVLDAAGLPWPQRQAFALFDRFALPRVACTPDLPMAALPQKLAEERASTDREGAVLYLEDADGAPVGLLKVKSNFYVKVRRTRQIFWSAIVDPLLHDSKAFADGSNAPESAHRKKGWEAAEARMRSGMQGLTHVEGCGEHWAEWADEAVGFLHWWRARFQAIDEAQARIALCRTARSKFGTVYRDYCRKAKLPGGANGA